MVKPRVVKTEAGWVVRHPGYGFNPVSSDSRPYPTQRRAFHAAESSQTTSAYPSTCLVRDDQLRTAKAVRLEVR